MARATHPLKSATLTATPMPRGTPHPPKLFPTHSLDVRTDPVGAPRMLHGRVWALDGKGVLYTQDGDAAQSWQTPGYSWFAVSPDGSEAWVVGRSAETRRSDDTIRTAKLTSTPDWQTIPVTHRSMWGVDGIAWLDADHIVVKSHVNLELIGRVDGVWKTLHKVKGPAEGPLRPFFGHNAVVMASKSRILVYGRRKQRLWKLNTVTIEPQRFHSTLPRIWFTPDGTLWVDNGRLWRADFTPPE
ncbi:MAG: hypothetical protein ACI8RZ_001719 [Myxococcota bacterium]|jgi:hypothetical protein